MLIPDVASPLLASAANEGGREAFGNECLVFDARLSSRSYGLCSRTNERTNAEWQTRWPAVIGSAAATPRIPEGCSIKLVFV